MAVDISLPSGLSLVFSAEPPVFYLKSICREGQTLFRKMGELDAEAHMGSQLCGKCDVVVPGRSRWLPPSQYA